MRNNQIQIVDDITLGLWVTKWTFTHANNIQFFQMFIYALAPTNLPKFISNKHRDLPIITTHNISNLS